MHRCQAPMALIARSAAGMGLISCTRGVASTVSRSAGHIPSPAPRFYAVAPDGSRAVFSDPGQLFATEMQDASLTSTSSPATTWCYEDDRGQNTQNGSVVEAATRRFFSQQPASDAGASGFDEHWTRVEQEHLSAFVRRAGRSRLLPCNAVISVTEVGCGNGRFSQLWPILFPNLQRLTLVEPQAHFLEAAMARFGCSSAANATTVAGSDGTEAEWRMLDARGPAGGQRPLHLRGLALSVADFLVQHPSACGDKSDDSQAPPPSHLVVTVGVAQYLPDAHLAALARYGDWLLLKEDVSLLRVVLPAALSTRSDIIGGGGRDAFPVGYLRHIPTLEHYVSAKAAQYPPEPFCDGEPDIADSAHMSTITGSHGPLHQLQVQFDLGTEPAEASLIPNSSAPHCQPPTHAVDVALCYLSDGSVVRPLAALTAAVTTAVDVEKQSKEGTLASAKDVRLLASDVQWDVPMDFYAPIATLLVQRE